MNNNFLEKIKTRIIINLLGLLGFVIVVVPSLHAKVVTDHYVIEDWLKFEPEEEFTLSGNQFFLKNYAKVGYYGKISDMVNKNEIFSNDGLGPYNGVFSATIPTIFSSIHRGSENALGIRLSWDRMGNHYADIIPPNINKIKEQGFDSIEEVSIWVWSGNYDHELTIVLNRMIGDQSVVSLGKLNFLGWKQLKARMPRRVKVGLKDNYLKDEEYYFDRFRVYTVYGEKVSNIYVFLDNFQVTRRLGHSGYFDGKNIIPVIRKELEGEEESSVDNSGDGNNNDNG